MANNIRIQTLDGKILHTCRIRAQRLVDTGTHVWRDRRTVGEIKAKTSSSDPRRFLVGSFPIFDFAYTDFEAHPELAEGALRYPMRLAKDQTSYASPWGD